MMMECLELISHKIGQSCELHSGLALRISIQNRPEFWIAPLHGVPLQMPWASTEQGGGSFARF